MAPEFSGSWGEQHVGMRLGKCKGKEAQEARNIGEAPVMLEHNIPKALVAADTGRQGPDQEGPVTHRGKNFFCRQWEQPEKNFENDLIRFVALSVKNWWIRGSESWETRSPSGRPWQEFVQKMVTCTTIITTWKRKGRTQTSQWDEKTGRGSWPFL